jgi:ubiquinone/menaquinone biosynthesis C-methylase UbiE
MSNQDLDKAYSGSPPQNYERYFVPTIGAPLAADLVRIAALRPGERVIDVACGTGVVTRLAAEAVGTTGTVTGLDLNPGMIAVARSVDPTGSSIQWHEGNAEAMPLPDAAFDVVLCQMGLQFVSQKPTALQEMRRVLAHGGRLALNVPGPTAPIFGIMEEGLKRHIGPQAAGFVRAVFSLHDPEEIRKLIEDAGFHNVVAQAGTKTLHLPSPAEFLWQYVYSTPLAGIVAEADEESRTALERDVVAEWQKSVKGGDFVCEQGLVQATAQKA